MAQIIDPTLRGHSLQSDILEAIICRLIDQIPEYSDQNCFLSDDPVPEVYSGGDEFCTVSMGDGNFPTEFFDGGGVDTTTEDGSVIIAPTLPTRGGSRYKKDRFISTEVNGKTLVERKRQILRAMLSPGWEPAKDTKPLLRDLLSPIRATAPGEVRVGQAKMLQMRVTFRTTFDWDLS